MNRKQVYIAVGEVGRARMPYSEVCMHMQIAGKEMNFRLRTDRAVQLYDQDWYAFSAPILPGEAGIYRDQGAFYYYVEDKNEVAADAS